MIRIERVSGSATSTTLQGRAPHLPRVTPAMSLSTAVVASARKVKTASVTGGGGISSAGTGEGTPSIIGGGGAGPSGIGGPPTRVNSIFTALPRERSVTSALPPWAAMIG